MDQVILNVSDFSLESMKSAKINSPNIYPVLNLSISLMALIVTTCLRLSGHYLMGTDCWELNFSLNSFSQNILW